MFPAHARHSAVIALQQTRGFSIRQPLVLGAFLQIFSTAAAASDVEKVKSKFSNLRGKDKNRIKLTFMKIKLIQIKLLVNFQTSRAFFNKPRGDLLLLVTPLSENGECIICFA